MDALSHPIVRMGPRFPGRRFRRLWPDWRPAGMDQGTLLHDDTPVVDHDQLHVAGVCMVDEVLHGIERGTQAEGAVVEQRRDVASCRVHQTGT